MNVYEIKRKIIWSIIADLKNLSREEFIQNILFFISFNMVHLLILFYAGKILPLLYFFLFVICYLIIICNILYYLEKNKEMLREKYFSHIKQEN